MICTGIGRVVEEPEPSPVARPAEVEEDGVGPREAEYQALIHAQQLRLSELEAAVADKSNLVATVHSNAQTLSRIMSQNKDLKTQLAEMQLRFVEITQKQMDVVSELQTCEYQAKQWKARAEELGRQVGGEVVVRPTVDARTQRHEAQLAEQIMKLQATNARCVHAPCCQCNMLSCM